MAQEGFLYEENVAKTLKKMNWVKPNYKPAGAASDRPDLDIFIDGVEYGCELKKNLASAGSLVVHHLGNKKYDFGDTEGKEEKEFLKEIGKKAGVLAKIRSKWRTEPFIQQDRDEEWAARVRRSGLSLRERYKHDLDACRDLLFSLPSSAISDYYNIKKTYYLNVGTHGFYLLGKDPAGLNKYAKPKIPQWSNMHTAILRVRVQSKGVSAAERMERSKGFPSTGGQGYQITMEMQFKNVRTSPYNIGPVVGKSANIAESKIVLP